MPKFAVIDGEDILNTILADSLEIAEQVTGKTCIEYTSEFAEPNGKYIDGTFIRKKPFPSWNLSEKTWQPPVSKPEDTEDGFWEWDEENTRWLLNHSTL